MTLWTRKQYLLSYLFIYAALLVEYFYVQSVPSLEAFYLLTKVVSFFGMVALTFALIADTLFTLCEERDS